MNITLAYNHDGLAVELPDDLNFKIYNTKPYPEPGDPATIIGDSLNAPIASPPLSEVAKGKESACVVISDVTRPVPNALLLPPLLEQIETARLAREKIVILVGTGIHRPNVGDELRKMVGDFVMDNYRIVNHESRVEKDQVFLGNTRGGAPVNVNRHYVEADLKILTGLIEPHMWAGFSGGRKGILPGISSVETMKHMHGYEMIADPGLGYGRLQGNPFHEAGLEALEMAGCNFLVNVTIDGERRVTDCFSGHAVDAHLAGCEATRPYVEHPFTERVDCVLISGGGLPLDHVLYQATKAMVVADAILKPEGTMIVAAGCGEGVGSPEFTALMDRAESVDQFMAMLREPGFFEIDQWCAQQIYEIRRRHEILFYTDGIAADKIRQYLLTPIDSVESGVAQCREKHGGAAAFAIFPEGPYVYGRMK